MKNIVRIALASLLAISGAAVTGQNASAEAPVDVYSTPGIHRVNGRTWMTACERYSVTTRCHTQIQATVVSQVNGAFVSRTGWAFNNLTYLPSPRSVWKGNPLGRTGAWTDAHGRAWRTECDTAATGRGACRSFAMAKVIARTASGYQWRSQWVFNSMTRFSTSTPRPQPDLGITFADPALTTCVRDALGLGAEGKLTGKAAASLEELACPEMQIASLEGIGQLPNLIALDVTGNEIDDLTPLGDNASLQQLLIGVNRIDDLTPLATLTELAALDISGNPVRDLGPLSGLTGLVAFAAADTSITTIAPLAALPDLYQLEVGYNPGLDLATIGHHTGLAYLGMAGTGIHDLTRLAVLTQLEWLDLGDNSLTSLAHLPKTLLGANLANNELRDLTGIERATGLTWLALDSNPIASAAPLMSLRHLATLSISHTRVTDLGPIGRLTRLTILDISGVPATDVSPLATLVRLDLLIAVDTAITDFHPLDALVDNGLTILTILDDEEEQARLAASAESLGLTRTAWLPASASPLHRS